MNEDLEQNIYINKEVDSMIDCLESLSKFRYKTGTENDPYKFVIRDLLRGFDILKGIIMRDNSMRYNLKKTILNNDMWTIPTDDVGSSSPYTMINPITSLDIQPYSDLGI